MDPTHRTRYSDSSLYDEVCVLCGATDSRGSDALDRPCPGSESKRKEYDEKSLERRRKRELSS